ncbi:head-tail adaptor protein [Pseudophaeobacter sp.]|uniref:head-tail adaptor protein n=1 Tax=Pseudophaeobacter sp. TaxID=1971739 RepID=UPI0032973FBE
MSKPVRTVLNRQLVLEDPQRVSDGAGGYTESWAPLGSLWAALAPQAGRTAGQEGGSLSLQRYRITLRAAPMGSLSRPRSGQRFREGARLFRIEAVSEADLKAHYLTCQCIEEVAP